MVIVWFLLTLNPFKRISFKSSCLVVVSNCSFRVIGCIAALWPRSLGLQHVNFIFSVPLLAVDKIYLFEHGRKINVLTFNTELLWNVLASSSWWCSSNPGGWDQTVSCCRQE
jgi:hypothetical protein